MIAIVDYEAGNIFSVRNALDFLGIDCILTDQPETLSAADGIILPGVGAFPAAMQMLAEKNLVAVLRREAKRKPFLGICLGMQVLFEKGYEFEETEGLGLIPGTIERIEAPGEVIPHMGWNRLEYGVSCPLLAGLDANTYVYFVHSYQAHTPACYVAASVGYGSARIPAMVTDGKTVFGAQFHPEKSGEAGLTILRNFGGLIS